MKDLRDLKMLIKTLEQLDIGNTGLVIDESRDGTTDYIKAEAMVIKDAKGFYQIAFVPSGD